MKTEEKKERNAEIKKMRETGSTYPEIALAYGISRQRAFQIANNDKGKKKKLDHVEYTLNKELLISLIYKRGMTMRQAANELGIRTDMFSKKIHGVCDFRLSEINALKELLNMTDYEFAYIFLR